MSCDLGSGTALQQNQQYTFDLSVNINRLQINKIFKIEATVTSSGDEQDPNDNQNYVEVQNTEFSEVEVIG